MSSTRHAADSSSFHQNRYMSDSAFADQRGLLGNLVAERAAILPSARKRELLFFLQAESLKPGGLKRVASEILEMFPDRLGTPTMHERRPGRDSCYDREASAEIEYELSDDPESFVTMSTLKEQRADGPRVAKDEFVDRCRSLATDDLDQFLSELCLNPSLRFNAPGDSSPEETVEEREYERGRLPGDAGYRRQADVPYFKGIVGALFDYQARKMAGVGKNYEETEITQRVFETMDFALDSHGLVIVNGNARIGKSTAAQAWCEMHPGQARYVSLVDASDEAGFYRPIARALGIACSYTRKACELRDRIADTLQRSGLMLVLDEAHYAWPQFLRPTALPRRVNWILTALVNYKLSVVLVTTPQFIATQKRVEKNTGWTSEQFTGRIKRFVNLPAELPEKDLEAIARFHLPGASKSTITLLVSYAISQQTYIAGMTNAIGEARYEAKLQKREKITYEDVEKVIKGFAAATSVAVAAPSEQRRGAALPMIRRGSAGAVQALCEVGCQDRAAVRSRGDENELLLRVPGRPADATSRGPRARSRFETLVPAGVGGNANG